MVLIRVGIGVLLMIRQPLPPPPPPGELRRVKITYRCSICYTEVRMTTAPEEDPRHRATVATIWIWWPPLTSESTIHRLWTNLGTNYKAVTS